MKNITFQILMLTALLLPACKSEAQKMVGATGNAQIEVIDFHSTHRCKTCLEIEKIARSVVETNFSKELKNGKIIFKTIDVDDDSNAQIAEKFEASGTALFVYNGKTGQAIDLTDAAFSYALDDAAKLREIIKNAIQKNLLQI